MPPATLCPEPQQWSLLCQGQLSHTQVEELTRHLEECPRCAAAVQALDGEDSLAQAMRGRDTELGEAVGQLIVRLKGWLSGPGPESAGGDPQRTTTLLAPPRGPGEIGRLGDYQVLQLLGTGGMGSVYLARQARLSRLVALKVILAGPEANPERLARFRREAEVVARLQHSNIVQLFEANEHEGRPYFAMEYVGRGSLAQHLAKLLLPARAAAELVEVLARAVQAAHDKGILHRDLKPANVLLAEDGTRKNADVADEDGSEGKICVDPPDPRFSASHSLVPKITDFGLAKQLDDPTHPTQSGALLGTPSYMAPEQAAGESVAIGPAVDVYGLGAILYECLTGRPPFRAATVLETLDQVRNENPLPPRRLQPKLPRDLQTICLKCLEKDPRRRYGSAEALADDLGRFLTGKPIVARPVRWWERAWKWARRNPAAAALAALSLLAALALPIGLAVHNAQLETALAQTRKQSTRADANYSAARASMGRMVDRLNAQRLANVPRLKELRRELLEDSLAFYQAILERADNPDPAVRLDAAFALAETGAIQVTLGRPDPAREHLQRASAILEELPADYRDRPVCRNKLAQCHKYLGSLAMDATKWDEAERHFRAHFTLYERLAGEDLDYALWQKELAGADHQLGLLFQSLGRLPEAQTHYERSTLRRTQLVAAHPGDESYRAQLAETHVNLGWLVGLQKRLSQAQAETEKAIGLLEPLHERHPDDLGYTLALSAACANLGTFLQQAGKRAEAEQRLTQAIGLADAALAREPQLEEARVRAANTHGMRAQLYEALGRWADSAKDWDHVVALSQGPNAWLPRALRAVALARAGDHARAAAGALALEQDPAITPDGLAALAGVYAVSVGRVRKDARLAPAERDALAEKYAVSAVAVLRKLQGQGYFQDTGHALNLVIDWDLLPLLGRPDFQRLLKEVASGKKK